MMRRIAFYILVLIIVFGSVVNAQEFNGGVLGGLSASEISGDRLEGPNKAGVYLGVFVNRYFSKRSSVQMELDFIQKGSKKNPDTLDKSTYRLRLNYIEMPVHYKFDLNERWIFEAGLSLGVLIYSEELADGYEWTAGGEFNKTDFSFNFGLYYRIVENLLINVRYSNSILAVRPNESGQSYQWNYGQYNEVLSFTLHYAIPGFSR